MGDPHRMGAIGKAIGVANIPARLLETNLQDLDNKPSKSDIAFADGISAFAMLLMGQSAEGIPAVLIKGVQYPFSPEARTQDILL